MVASGVEPDAVSFSTLMSASAKGGNLTRTMDTLKEMHEAGVAPNAYSYNALLLGFTRQPELWEMALEVLDRMQAAGVQPDDHSYSYLYTTCAGAGQWEHASALMQEMSARKFTAPKRKFAEAVAELAEAEQWVGAVAAWEALDRTKTEIQAASIDTYQAAMQAYAELGQLKSVLTLWEEIYELGLEHAAMRMPAETYLALLEACGDDWRVAASVIESMVQADRVQDADSFHAVVNACTKASSAAHGARLGVEALRSMYTAGAAPSAEAMHALLECCVKAGDMMPLITILWDSGEVGLAAELYMQTCATAAPVGSDGTLELDLEGLGSSQAVMRTVLWLAEHRRRLIEGHALANTVVLVTSRGRHVPVNGALEGRQAVAAVLERLGAPFAVSTRRPGCLAASGQELARWLASVTEAELWNGEKLQPRQTHASPEPSLVLQLSTPDESTVDEPLRAQEVLN